MSSYDKVVKSATKPKSGGVKPKYIDPIIATTFATDGSLQDVCRALASRLRDSSSFVVFKSLIILHTMIRNGEVDNVLAHLSSDAGNFRLRNISSASFSGANAPQTLPVYAQYLDERVRAYRELKHDVIRSSEKSRGGASNSNRLRKLTVERGLLREVSTTQKVASVLMQCSFFLEHSVDELVMAAFRMILKDLLAIYTAINEGVINILEHYFEMAKSDAERALELYRRFCRQTENVVAFLNSARKTSDSLNLAIPRLKHAPVSLAGALEEYLNDPNFEQNRKEYKENKRVADSGGSAAKTTTTAASVPKSESKKSITIQEPAKPERKVKPPTANQDLQDFFASIETDSGQNVFSNVPVEQSFFALQAQPTGMMGMNGFGGMNGGQFGLQPQMTGFNPFLAQQQTGFGGGFGNPQMMGGMQQPQMSGFLQPQQTGFNPFRQQVMAQPTGFGGPFGSFDGQSSMFNQQQQQQQQPRMPSSPQPQPTGSSQAQPSSALSAFNSAFGGPSSSQQPQQQQPPQFQQQPPASSTTPKPLMPQKTGSRNPFAPPPGSTPPPASPPGPKGPSLNQLAMGAFGNANGNNPAGGHYSLGANAWDGQTNPSQQGQQQSQLVPQKTGLIGNIASEFAFGNRANGAPASSTPTSPGPTSPFPQPQAQKNDFASQFGALSFQPTGQQQQQQQQQFGGAIQPQPTGFGGSAIRPFKPESSFGASLASNPQFASPASTPGGVAPQMTGNPFAMAANSSANGASASAFQSSPWQTQPQQQQQQGQPQQPQSTQPFGQQPQQQQSTQPFGQQATQPFQTQQPQQTSTQPFGQQPQQTSTQPFGQQQQPQQTATQPFGQQPQQQSAQPFQSQQPFGQTQPQQPFQSQQPQPFQQQQPFQTQQPQGFVQPQPTGFGGSAIKPFKPSSDFGKTIANDAQPTLFHF